MFSQVGQLPSFHGWMIFHHVCLCTHIYINIFFIHLSFGGHSDCFHVLTLVNSLAVNVLVLVAQSYLTLCRPVDCSPPGSSIHGTLRQEYWSGLPCPSPVISFREWFHFLWIYTQIWDFWIMFISFSIFFRNPYTVLHSGYTNLHPHPWCIGVPLCPHPHCICYLLSLW